MKRRELILQGFAARTHGAAASELFDLRDIQKSILSIAFVSESGIEQIEEQLRAAAQSLTVFAGIRNEITSHQGLLRLLNMGCRLFTVDTGSRTVVFHPKLYMARGETVARLLVGSANLTLGGLNNNIEAGIILELDMGDSDDREFIHQIEFDLGSLPTTYPDHITEVKDATLLDQMLATGLLVDETALPPPRPVTSARMAGGSDTVSPINLKVTPIRRASRRASALSKGRGPSAPGRDLPPGEHKLIPATTGVDLELVWESKPLTRRDLTIPTRKGTHETGSINLDKGLLPEEVDQRHYFRDEVFSDLAWSASSPTVNEAYANFHLVIKGISYGEFRLRIGYSHSTTSKTYLQRNATTRLSWGLMQEFVAKDELIGRTLALYRDRADTSRYTLDID